MGKSLPSSSKLQELTRIISSSEKLQRPQHCPSQVRVPPSPEARVDSERVKALFSISKMETTAAASSSEGQSHQPLSVVVADCVKRWFQDTLREAKAGDTSMQVLVGQMYYSGYGVAKDPRKGRVWISRASKGRSSAWRVSDKQPGYNASDSDSDDQKDEPK
ncbi:hypothetical protein TIFTF001_010423 [Ficus carica]|uniref:Sel1-like protein n=1 Tax=Ficus carica TaxID=3494 RepID=A0AA87ZVG8_FICCA|nr:hypothetical protein TIFTF001_010423 [Ficus carica]